MTDIEQKALALSIEVREDARMRLCPDPTLIFGNWEALCRAIERHEAFRQEVSEALSVYQKADGVEERSRIWDALTRFIIAKPDPLVEAWQIAFPGNHIEDARDECAKISAAIEKRGGRIIFDGSGA